MQAQEEARRRSVLRPLIFALLAAVSLLGLAAGWLRSPGEAELSRWAELYRRSGDSIVRLHYLAETRGLAGGRLGGLLVLARNNYALSRRVNPDDPRSQVSLALLSYEAGEESAARSLLSAAATQRAEGPDREAVVATLAIALSDTPSLEEISRARAFLLGLAPGRLFLADAYQRAGRPDLAGREREAQARWAEAFLPVWLVMVGCCGLLLLAGMVGALVWTGREVARRLKGVRRPAPQALPPAPWDMREAVEALILLLFLGLAASTVVALVRPAAGGEALLALPVVVGGIGAIAWVAVASPGRLGLGWRTDHLLRDVWTGLVASGVVVIPVLLLEQALQGLMQERPYGHPLIPVFAGATGWLGKVSLAAFACAIIPAVEEAVFRGILYRALRRHWSVAGAALASAIVFAVAHGSAPTLLPIAILGVLYAYLYETSGSLVAPSVAHGAFNAFNLAIVLALVG